MPVGVTPEERTAVEPDTGSAHPVTLMNSFVVPDGRDGEFLRLWTESSEYFRSQPGFRSLRLHRAVTAGSEYRYVNVARWASYDDYLAAHATATFRRLVSQEAWAEFPSRPVLYEVVLSAGDDTVTAP